MPRLISHNGPPPRLDQSYIEFWGEDGLFRWSKLAVSLATLPAESKAFLVEVGLPKMLKGGSWGFGTWNSVLFSPEDQPGRLGLRQISDRPHVLVDSEDGRVIWAGRKATRNFPADYPELGLNESLEQFALCLTEYHKLAQRIAPYDHSEDQRSITVFRRAVTAIDPATLADRQSYWSSTIFDMRILE